MVVIDPHSKWPEVFVMEGTTAEETFNTLFACLELPDQMCVRQRTTVHIRSFRNFITANGIKLVTGAPYFASY